MNVLVWIVLFVIGTLSLHFGLGVMLVLAAIIGAILATLGCLLVVVVLDGDGSLW
jgi:hypothetical protein